MWWIMCEGLPYLGIQCKKLFLEEQIFDKKKIMGLTDLPVKKNYVGQKFHKFSSVIFNCQKN